MKKMLILLDGIGDLSYEKFNDKTPLEFANTPNLDDLAKKGSLGYMYSISEDYAPESDTAVISILGNNFDISERAEFEALGEDLKIKRGDLVLRANFGTIENLESRKIIDRRAGRNLTDKEANELALAINTQVKLPVKFRFFPTLQHRGILVFYGGFSDNITNTDSYFHEKGKIWVKENFEWSVPLDEEDNSEFAANLVNSFVSQAFKILNEHPINKKRRKKGLMAANMIFTRDPGVEMPELKKFRKSMAIVNMPLEKGIAKASGMDVFSFPYPNMKGYDAYENLELGLNKMIDFAKETLKKNHKDYDFCYIHIKETDVSGHDNKPYEKKHFIEIIDKKLFSFIREFVIKNKISLIVTGDHSTPCKMKTHTSDPLPLLFYNPNKPGEGAEFFGESICHMGSLGKIYGKDLLKKLGFSY